MNSSSQRNGAVDLSAPQTSGEDVIDVIAKTISSRDDHHIGFQIFDSTNWTFSEVILFTEFTVE